MEIMQINKSIILKSENFVTNLLDLNLPDWAVYHNLAHTVETVEGCKKIALGMDVSNVEFEILIIASWFHDTGYIKSPDRHEEISCEFAEKFLSKHQYPSQKILKIVNCIMATKITNKPQNKLEEIISDADLISLGQKNYYEFNNLLKLEIEKRENRKIDTIVWLKRSLRFLQSHKFYTKFAQETLRAGLDKNIDIVKSEINIHNAHMNKK